jgi:hypothetical protein
MKIVLYYIFIEIYTLMNVISIIKIYLSWIYSTVHIGKNLPDTSPIDNSLKKGDALSPLLFNGALQYAIRKI